MIINYSLKNKESIFNWIAYTGVILLFIGFLFNRVTNNLGSILIGIYAVYHLDKIKHIFTNPWMISFFLLAFVHIVSDVMTEGLGFASGRGVMKLSLVLYPAFIFSLKPSKELLKKFMGFVIAMMFISSMYSLSHFFMGFNDILDTYKESKVAVTLSYSDHIRVSWMAVISCIFAFYILVETKGIQWFLMLFYIIFQIVFLHILGSKTGLLVLYISVFIFLVYYLVQQNKWYLAFIIPSMFLMPWLAYKTIPPLQERINFVYYDFEHYSKGLYRDGLSDAVRYYSLVAGKDIIVDNPWIGTGFMPLQIHVNEWYKVHVAEMNEEMYFLPSSEIVIYWAAAGILGLLAILFHIFYPFFHPILRRSKWFLAFFIPAIISFTYETHLENQLSLFVYGFLTSVFWYIAIAEKEKEEKLGYG